jgi:NAD(P)-dependent dehydrogenase (short-subunit alcohol dehydrogenase family)
LLEDGYDVAATHHGDLSDRGTCVALVKAGVDAGPLCSIIHTAGLSPATGSWQAIIKTNLIGTEHLFQELEGAKASGYTAIVITSMAGHMRPDDAAIDRLFDAPLAPDLLERAEGAIAPLVDPQDAFGLGSIAYAYTKSANIRMVRGRSTAWARQGNRILSVSPGTIKTPMGLAEAAQNPGAKAVVDATPVGRWGSVLDIAQLCDFLVSDKASFITGTDVLIDGGVTAALKLGQLLG